MKANLSEKYELSIYVYTIERKNITMVCNMGFGTYLKLPTECWQTIEKYIVHFSPEEICEAAHVEDREYYREIFASLIEKRILVQDKEWLDTIDLALTNRCNLQCTHCAAAAETMLAEEKLTTADWYDIIDKVLAVKPNMLVLTGGEPMVRKDFFDITRYIRKNYKGKLELMSNGLLITKENIAEIINSFDAITISLDGYDEETCAAIRGKGVFGKVLDVIKLLIDNGFRRERLSMSMVETELTVGKTYKFHQLCDELGIRSVVRHFSAIGRGKENKEWLIPKKEDGVKSVEKEKRLENGYITRERKYVPCQNCRAGRGKIFINHVGDIFPCQLLDDRKYCHGNILETENLSELIINRKNCNVKEIEKFEQLLIENHPKCSKCDVAPFCRYCVAAEMYDENRVDENCEQKKKLISHIIWGE